jgi:PAS domain-containing protein
VGNAGRKFFTGIIRDSSEPKRTEQTIRRQSAALEAAVNAVVVADAQGTIEWVNPRRIIAR